MISDFGCMNIRKTGDDMPLILRELTLQDKEAFLAFLSDWKDENTVVPYTARLLGRDYETFLQDLVRNKQNMIDPANRVPETLFFLFKGETIIGSLSLRHFLNQRLYELRGHIGYGIAPSMRNKGYGTKILSMGLDVCKNMRIPRVLITCHQDNRGSASVIINNGGILENEVVDGDHLIQRYWILVSIKT